MPTQSFLFDLGGSSEWINLCNWSASLKLVESFHELR